MLAKKISIITVGKFHHFNLAEQIEKRNCLDFIISGYPYFKLKKEKIKNKKKILSYSIFYLIYRIFSKISKKKYFSKVEHYLNYLAHKKIASYAKKKIINSNILIASSGSGLESGLLIKKKGGIFICDRGSTHILNQKNELQKEYSKLGLKFNEMNERIIKRELKEYKNSDIISVPSSYVLKTFVKYGVNKKKLFLNPYGVNLKKFKKNKKNKDNKFKILFVGKIGVRKGTIYLFKAFENLNLENKHLTLIGEIEDKFYPIFKKYFNHQNMTYFKKIPGDNLKEYYSNSDVFVLPSLEEGLALVINEALACGCPVIATRNTGVEDIFKNNQAGFIIKFGKYKILLKKLELLAKSKNLREKFSKNAVKIVRKNNGWDKYGHKWMNKINQLKL